MQVIRDVPNNESAWNYLTGLVDIYIQVRAEIESGTLVCLRYATYTWFMYSCLVSLIKEKQAAKQSYVKLYSDGWKMAWIHHTY